MRDDAAQLAFHKTTLFRDFGHRPGFLGVAQCSGHDVDEGVLDPLAIIRFEPGAEAASFLTNSVTCPMRRCRTSGFMTDVKPA